MVLIRLLSSTHLDGYQGNDEADARALRRESRIGEIGHPMERFRHVLFTERQNATKVAEARRLISLPILPAAYCCANRLLVTKEQWTFAGIDFIIMRDSIAIASSLLKQARAFASPWLISRSAGGLNHCEFLPLGQKAD